MRASQLLSRSAARGVWLITGRCTQAAEHCHWQSATPSVLPLDGTGSSAAGGLPGAVYCGQGSGPRGKMLGDIATCLSGMVSLAPEWQPNRGGVGGLSESAEDSDGSVRQAPALSSDSARES